jgi:hypothetical protein
MGEGGKTKDTRLKTKGWIRSLRGNDNGRFIMVVLEA